ncbi:tetratricopeptide repeat protein [soil metagenome]
MAGHPRSLIPGMIDVTDATFQAEVFERSDEVAVVVDLWAPWCGPCHQLGPLLEQAVDATAGQVVLAKVNVDENPQVSQAFKVQGIPAVYALKDRKVVDSFIGAHGESAVNAFVARLLPSEAETTVASLVAVGDEASLRQAIELDPGHEGALVALAELLVGRGEGDDALALLERIPESAETRRVAALARTGAEVVGADVGAKLDGLLERVKGDDDARQEFVDLLELLGPDDPRTGEYRKALTARLF